MTKRKSLQNNGPTGKSLQEVQVSPLEQSRLTWFRIRGIFPQVGCGVMAVPFHEMPIQSFIRRLGQMFSQTEKMLF
ncbi:hypothetical protein RF55_25624 [Lasius niger]|uniref:Uncharacterized protein n=1 Tax=Lasius niger TaxID=67767 RepID=A0A0J7JUZ3_LASNI|nr:hypothetical protein RF55_25624 [Lasius niger]